MADEGRELDLVGKVEFRIAVADTDAKLERVLQTYLAPLLLKLTSSQKVRNKVIEVCQHVTTRTAPPSAIKLPVAALFKQFRDVENALVRHFDLQYIQRGVGRLPVSERVQILQELMRDVVLFQSDRQASQMFHLLLELLPLWEMPEKGSKDDTSLRTFLSLSPDSAGYLASRLQRFFLLETKGQSHGLDPNEVTFFNLGKADGLWEYSLLLRTKIAAAKLISSGAFTTEEQLMPAVVLSADSNATLSSIGDTMFKQTAFDLEDSSAVTELFQLYFRSRPKLQTRILSLLSKSQEASTRTEKIMQILTRQLGGEQPAGLEGSKLRAQIFAFLTWVARVGPTVREIAPLAVSSLKEFVESQGWPSSRTVGHSLSQPELDIRAHAYEALGLFAPSSGGSADLDTIRWLFTALRCDDSSPQSFVSIEQALGRVMNTSVADLDEKAMGELRSLFLWNMTAAIGDEDSIFGFSTKRSVKYTTVRFSNRCFPFNDVEARWIDLLAVGNASSDRSEIAEEGRKGLDPYWYRMLNPAKDGAWISTKGGIHHVFPSFKTFVQSIFQNPERSQLIVKSLNQYAETLTACVSFARNLLVEEALSETTDLDMAREPEWERRIDALLANDQQARSMTQNVLREMEESLFQIFLNTAFTGLTAGQTRCAEHLMVLCSLSSNSLLMYFLDNVQPLMDAVLSNSKVSQVYAAKLIGILVSHPNFAQKQRVAILEKLSDILGLWNSAIGQQANQVIGSALALGYIQSRLALRDSHGFDNQSLRLFLRTLLDILNESRDQSLRDAAANAIGSLSLCTAQKTDAISDDFIEPLTKDAKKERPDSIAALGRMIWFFSRSEESALKTAVQGLYDLHEIRRPETQFAIGEALSIAAAGFSSKATMADFDVDADPPGACFNEDFVISVMDKVIPDCKASKPTLRKASAIWLLSLVEYCGKLEFIQSRLRECQAIFSRLLSDRDEVIQETGSRGLGLVFEMGDKSLKDDLVRDLVQSFTGNTVKLSGSITDETELFEPGALPTGDGSVTTYKDIMNLASEVGEPSLVYKFMNLASNNAIWSSRAAFGRFGLSNVLSDSTYLAQNKKFYPKLFRYRFDPNTNVQRAMNDIWTAVVKDSGAVLNEHFDLIIDDLLKCITGKEWRVRQASCDAIADLIQGREVDRYEKYLDQIWRLGFKALDDIKESVRSAAMKLCRTLTNLLIRNLEVGDGNSLRAKKMLDHALPFLRDQLDSGAPAEVRTYAIITLIDILKKSPQRSIRKFAPEILETLLSSLSSMEHESVNYLHLNAEKYGLTTAKIDEARISGMNTSPLTEAIERCLESLDQNTVGEAMDRLESTVKTAIGLPSKVGCSRVLVSLCVRFSALFRPYADKFVRLVRKHILDRNESVSVSYSMALGYLARVATDDEMEETGRYAHKLYFETEDSSHRAVSAEILYAISKNANDRFMSFAAAFLPLAYIARQDVLDQVRENFDKTWKDNVGGSRAVILYFSEITRLVSQHINSSQWAIKHACALAIADLVASHERAFENAQAMTIWPVLEQALAGKTWEGKEKVLAAFVKFSEKSGNVEEEVWSSMKSIALREARRQNAAYRPFGIAALGDLSARGNDGDFYNQVLDFLDKCGEDFGASEDVNNEMDIDGGETPSRSPKILKALVKTLFQAISSPAGVRSARTGPKTGAILISKAASSDKQDVRFALYDGISNFGQAVAQERLQGGSQDQRLSEATEQFILAFVEGTPSALHDAENEATRKKRAEALKSYSSIRQQPNQRVLTWIKVWANGERSGTVREVLDMTCNKFEQ